MPTGGPGVRGGVGRALMPGGVRAAGARPAPVGCCLGGCDASCDESCEDCADPGGAPDDGGKAKLPAALGG
eukprot:2041226-Prymnesium_polylepis.1